MLKAFPLLPRLFGSPVRRICISKMSSPELPLCPKFKSLENEENNIRVNSDGFRFRVVSYNILAQVYVKSSYFPHSPSPCLKWKARSQAILTVLKSLDADFLCIQELDEYDSFYEQNMKSLGYSGIYVQRSGQKRDGCGIFHKGNSAEMVLEEKIEYNDLVDSVKNGTTVSVNRTSDALVGGNEEFVPHAEGSPPKNGLSHTVDPNDPHVRLKRDCVGLMAAFKLRDPSNHFVIVANTHLYWDPEWIDVKIAQAKYLLFRLAQFKKIVSNKFDCTPSVILAGDFNSTPGDMVYQLLISGNSSAIPVPEHSEEAPIPLSSVYAFIGGEPPFTNCTPDFTNTLDYIFFSPTEGLRPVSFLELPGPESCDVIGGLPNHHHPSDHLPIGTDFEIIRT
ncbi:carbon catabolite repressor protein 4 homolog 4 isoform X2 [Telopea speciosissima]|uniref:carbon catabolite repressor protein 4 homolog 4 isoform X2 n=1 Tax=Telopea speciosissima TaxID=54955 RepID=UPI001CC70349|nr:carbon catabolite repressor protein 4 homolog 4 isoform X2 [Telopea speciosissima]